MRRNLHYLIISALVFVTLFSPLTFAAEPAFGEDSVSDNVLEIVGEENNATEDTVLEPESTEPMVSTEHTESIELAEPVLRLLVPTKINFILDPYGIAGDRTLDSPEYSIINYSNVDVDVEINELAYSFSDNGTFFASTQPLDLTQEEEDKAVYMFLRRIAHPSLNEMDELEESSAAQIKHADNDDFLILDTNDGSSFKIRLKAANYDENGGFLSLNEDSVFLFKIMGDIRMGHSAPWKSGDLSLHMVYSWTPVTESSADEPDTDEPAPNERDTDQPDAPDADEPDVSDGNMQEEDEVGSDAN